MRRRLTTRKLRVWGGITGANTYTIVAEYTKKAAVERLKSMCRMSRHHFDGYWSETGNASAIQTARFPGVWTEVGDHSSNEFKERR